VSEATVEKTSATVAGNCDELDEHLGYQPHDAAGRNNGNFRNGGRPKTVDTEVGPIELDVPATATPASPHSWCASANAPATPAVIVRKDAQQSGGQPQFGDRGSVSRRRRRQVSCAGARSQ
jgi:hypothetical protein